MAWPGTWISKSTAASLTASGNVYCQQQQADNHSWSEEEPSMATFVLVHGGWHGGWCWQKVIPFLAAAGHELYAPTLTGLAERASELSSEVGLETHIQDI